jgi:hypothetical protein
VDKMEAQDRMLRRDPKSLTPASFAVAILCCGVTPAAGVCAASGSSAARGLSAAPDSSQQSVLLGSSQAISEEFEAAKARDVAHAFADVQVGSGRAAVSPEELQMMLGAAKTATAGSQDGAARSKNAELATVEIESGASSGIHESAVAPQVPFGFRGMAWALQHPTQAWRLVLPVLGADESS